MPIDGNYAPIADLEKDEQYHEVFARYGLACYMAQVFEHGLVNLLILWEKLEGRLPEDEDYDKRFLELFKKMLGRQIGLIEKENRLQESDIALCRKALAQRNRLSHNFWRDEIGHFSTVFGRQYLLDEVDAARLLFVEADAAATAVLYRIGAAHGVTPEAVEEAADRLREELMTQEPGT